MKMFTCYLCNTILTSENVSLEHIIPNLLGGRLKSDKLICAECNKKSGQLYESQLSMIATVFCSKFNIKRERGNVPNYYATEDATGKKIIISPGGEVRYVEPEIIHTEKSTTVRSYSIKRASEELERIKKIVEANGVIIESIIYDEYVEAKHIEHSTKFKLNSDLYLRSISKILINYYLLKTNDLKSLKYIISFLQNDSENLFGWYLNLDIAKNLHSDKPYHILIVKGEKRQKALYGYVELFGKIGHVILLNGRYEGPDIQLNYTFDPVSGDEIDYIYDFKLSVSHIINHIQEKPGTGLIHTINI